MDDRNGPDQARTPADPHNATGPAPATPATAALSWQRMKALTAVAVALALGWTLYITYQYHDTRKPLANLPGLPGVGALFTQQPPSFQRALYGPEGAPLARPLAVAFSPRGDRLYVTEGAGERTTVVLDRNGVPIGRLAPPDTQPGGRLPLYIAVDAGGTVYVSDRLRGVIDMYSPSGEHKGTYQPEGEAPLAPMGLAFDRQGNFYVTDIPDGEHRLLVYDTAGKLKLSFGKQGPEQGQFSFPSGIAVDASGRIFVADSNNSRVQIFDSGGTPLEIIGRGGIGSLAIPRGLAIDDEGRLLIVDTNGQVVEVWDVAGSPKRLYAFGGQGVGDGEFDYPNGITLDRSGRLYVTDRMNNRIHVWSY